MSLGKANRIKRKRHQGKQALKFGNKAKPRPISRSGRTGKIRSAKLKNAK